MIPRIRAVALALTLMLTSISGGQLHRAEASRAQAGGTLTIAFDVVPDTLNPANTGYTAVGFIVSDVFDSLVYITSDAKVTPWLATAWKISNDGKTYTFFLRHDVTFQDGTPFDAAAVVANIKYIEDPSTQSKGTISALGPYQSVTAVGKYEVVYTLKSPYTPLLLNLGSWQLGMQSPTAIKKYGKEVGNHPVGTGPFEFVSYVRPTAITFQRNPNYHWAPPALHHNGPADLDKIVYDIVTSGNVRVDELQTGQAQVAASVPPLFYKTLKNNPAYLPLPIAISGAGVHSVINNALWPTNDLAVRQAINYAIDKNGVIKLADAGQYPPTWGPLQQGTYGYDPSLDGMYAYNPAKAAQILEKDGWTKVNGIWTKGGRQLRVRMTLISQAGDFDDMGTAQAGYLNKFGILTDIVQIAGTAWEASNTNGTYNLTGPLQFSGLDADLLRLMLTPGQYFDWSKFNNPTVTQLVTKALAIPNGPQRQAMYWQAEKIIMDQAAMLPIRYNQWLYLTSSKVRGVQILYGGVPDYYTASVQ